MEVLLREPMKSLGNRGEVVKVAPGYARNYLFPKKLAVPVSEGNKKQLEVERRNYERKQLQVRSLADEAKAKIEEMELELKKRAGENNHLFGSVTTTELAQILGEKGFEVDRRKITIPHIKEVGEYTGTVKLHHEVEAEFKLKVVPSN